MTDFRLCLTCKSCSQASICHYTQKFIQNKLELTFVGLRYLLGDYRPSQTNHLKSSSKIDLVLYYT